MLLDKELSLGLKILGQNLLLFGDVFLSCVEKVKLPFFIGHFFRMHDNFLCYGQQENTTIFDDRTKIKRNLLDLLLKLLQVVKKGRDEDACLIRIVKQSVKVCDDVVGLLER